MSFKFAYPFELLKSFSMQEKLSVLILAFCVFYCFACQSLINKILLNDFPQKEFVKVISYKMNGQLEEIVKDDKLAKHLITAEETLSEKEINRLLDILSDNTTYGDFGKSCFEPRLGYVFYDENNEIAAHVTICLACSQIKTSPYIGASVLGKKGTSQLHELEEIIF